MLKNRSSAATLALAFVLHPAVAEAQDLDVDMLPVSGSLVYHALLHGHDMGVALRFGGRVALEVAPALYVGFSVGSWSAGYAVPGGHAMYGDLQAVVYLLYAQHYVLPNGFIRGGGGVGDTRNVLPRDAWTVRVEGSILPAASIGAGWDFGVADYLFVTLSGDFTYIFGARRPPEELNRALMLGVGLTLR